MTGLISFVLLLLGGFFLIVSGMLQQDKQAGSAAFIATIGFVLQLCAWWLA